MTKPWPKGNRKGAMLTFQSIPRHHILTNVSQGINLKEFKLAQIAEKWIKRCDHASALNSAVCGMFHTKNKTICIAAVHIAVELKPYDEYVSEESCMPVTSHSHCASNCTQHVHSFAKIENILNNHKFELFIITHEIFCLAEYKWHFVNFNLGSIQKFKVIYYWLCH